jgi:hypothetical protein
MALGNLEAAEVDIARCRERGGEPTPQAARILREMKQAKATSNRAGK